MFIQTNIQQQFQSSGESNPLLKLEKADKSHLDSNEIHTLQFAFILGLGDKATRHKYYSEALEGKLTSFQEERIKDIQRGLKKDGKYKGEIDGKFGPESTAALQEMIEENKKFKEATILLERSGVKENNDGPLTPTTLPQFSENLSPKNFKF